MELANPSLLWFLAGIVLLLLEISMPGFILFFFGIGAWVTALAAWLYPLGINSQILTFIIASLISLFALRGFVQKAFRGSKSAAMDDHVMAETGAHVVVVSDILPPAEGKVKYSGTTWRARSTERLQAGEMAAVIKQDGLVMVVQGVENSEM